MAGHSAGEGATFTVASRWALLLSGVLGVITLVGGVYVAYAAWHVGLPPLSIAFSLALFVLPVRVARIRIRIDNEAVTVRNVLRTTTIAWTDVTAVGWQTVSWGQPTAPGLAFACRNGRVVTATATAGLRLHRLEALFTTVRGHAVARGIPVQVAPADLSTWQFPAASVHPPLKARAR